MTLYTHLHAIQKTRIRVPKWRNWKMYWGYIDLGTKTIDRDFTLFVMGDQSTSRKIGPFEITASYTNNVITLSVTLGSFPILAESFEVGIDPVSFDFRWPEGGILEGRITFDL